jgi:hypothetical protein
MSTSSSGLWTDMQTNFGGSALFTDLYELTMAQAYAAEGMKDDDFVHAIDELRAEMVAQ